MVALILTVLERDDSATYRIPVKDLLREPAPPKPSNLLLVSRE